MKGLSLKLIPPVLLISFGVFCLYNLYLTDWFDIHPIWILSDFHLYIIFISFIVSGIYYYSEVSRNLVDELYMVEILLENPYGDNEFVMKELAKRFCLEEVENEIVMGNAIVYNFYKKTSIGIRLKIFIYIDDCYCLIYLKRSFISCILGNKLLKKIEFVVENEFEKYQEKNYNDKRDTNSDLNLIQSPI